MPIQNKKLAAELRRLGQKDQVRRRVFKLGDTLDDTPDRDNTKRLKAIVKRCGWPTIGRVGRAASRAAWLIAQHAIFDRSFQRLALREMTRAHAQAHKDIEAYQIAYLTDRLSHRSLAR